MAVVDLLLLLVVGFQPEGDAFFAVCVGDGVGKGGFEAG